MTNPKRDKVELIAHLMRRAGFGASPAEASDLTELPYDQIVQQLVFPNKSTWIGEHMVRRFDNEASGMINPQGSARRWLYRMITSDTPLIEKMPLFWHGIFATGVPKVINGRVLSDQIDMFRQNGMGRFDDLLLALAQDPAMIVWLDNQENNKDSINENWGRELLELFSMGVGNYTENDIKECARAFTGWTIANSIPQQPYGRYAAQFLYNPGDHDNEEKTFLGETGNFSGEDVIDIIVKQPATARFISRHLYNYFVADDVDVASWMDTPPQDMTTVNLLEEEYFRSGYNIGSMLRVLFNSDAFKNSKFTKVKGPIETIIGTLRMVGDWTEPKPGLEFIYDEMRYMGQEILNPPSVEGWHTGREWIDGGTLAHRVNFVSDRVADTNQPGIQMIINRLASESTTHSPEALVDGCLRMLGEYEISEETHQMLVQRSSKGGEVTSDSQEFASRVSDTLRMIAATKEYLYA